MTTRERELVKTATFFGISTAVFGVIAIVLTIDKLVNKLKK